MANRQSLARNAGVGSPQRVSLLLGVRFRDTRSLEAVEASETAIFAALPQACSGAKEREPFRQAMVNFYPGADRLGVPSGARRRAPGQKFRINALTDWASRRSRRACTFPLDLKGAR